MNKKETGRLGEYIASNYLAQNGVKILEKNFRVKTGEIDIIGLEKNILIFYEVKTRTNSNFGTPAESVTYYKQMHIKNTAMEYINKTKPKFKGIRFDVVEVFLDNNLMLKNIHHIINAF